MPALGSVDALQPIAAAPPNLREEMCGKNRTRPAAEEADEDEDAAASSDIDPSSAYAATLQNLRGRAADRADARALRDDGAADPGLGRREPQGADGSRRSRPRRRKEEEARPRPRPPTEGEADQAGPQRRRG